MPNDTQKLHAVIVHKFLRKVRGLVKMIRKNCISLDPIDF